MKHLLLAFACLLVAPLPARAQQVPMSEMMERVGFDQKLGARLPLDARFVDESGRELALGGLFGERPVVVAFVYYECPMLCTLILNGLLRCLKKVTLDVGADFDVVAIGIDPDETPELARQRKAYYVDVYERPESARGWHFLTGTETEIRRAADAAGFRYVYLEEEDEYAHASGVVVATPDGILSHYFYGVEYSPRDLRLGLVESSSGKVGSPLDQVLLLCYQYDPLSGKYGLAIMNAIRALGALTVLALVAFIARSLWRERRSVRVIVETAES